MKLKVVFVCCLFLFTLTGCTGSRLNIENINMTILIGIDLNEKNEVVVYFVSPVFRKKTEGKDDQYKVQTFSIQQARDIFDTSSPGVFSKAKTQVVLVGKNITKQENWYSIFDVLNRDSTTRKNADVVVVDGSVNDIFHFSAKGKPNVTMYIPDILNSTEPRGITERVSLKKFYQMEIEKGVTPFAPELTVKDESIKITGIALLDKKNKYQKTLSNDETKLLKMMKKNVGTRMSLTFKLKEHKKKYPIFQQDAINIEIANVRRKIDKKMKNGKYEFTVHLTIPMRLEETPIKTTNKNTKKLEKEIEKNLDEKFNRLVQTLQENKVDPFGFGVLARTMDYKEWKRIENNWTDVYKDTDIKVKTEVIITESGIMK